MREQQAIPVHVDHRDHAGAMALNLAQDSGTAGRSAERNLDRLSQAVLPFPIASEGLHGFERFLWPGLSNGGQRGQDNKTCDGNAILFHFISPLMKMYLLSWVTCWRGFLSHIPSPQTISNWSDWRSRSCGTAPATNPQPSAARD